MDFVFDFNATPGKGGAGGTIKSMNSGNVPALEGVGVAYALITLKPCGGVLRANHAIRS